MKEINDDKLMEDLILISRKKKSIQETLDFTHKAHDAYRLGQRSARIRTFTVTAISIAAVLLVSLVVIPSLIPINGASEFQVYYSRFQPETAIRGGVSTDNSNEVVTLYLSGNYEQGIQKADSLLVTQPHNIQLLFFKGLLATELNHSDQASQLFLQVIPEGGSYAAFARWYLALNYLKKGNFTACREQLALLKKMEDHPYEKQIGKLYRRLRFLKNQ